MNDSRADKPLPRMGYYRDQALRWEALLFQGRIKECAEEFLRLATELDELQQRAALSSDAPVEPGKFIDAALNNEPNIDTLDFNRLRAGDRRALNVENQPIFDAYFARSAIEPSNLYSSGRIDIAPSNTAPAVQCPKCGAGFTAKLTPSATTPSSSVDVAREQLQEAITLLKEVDLGDEWGMLSYEEAWAKRRDAFVKRHGTSSRESS